ncbi:NshR/TsnR family 23S rRNA methyltransferase [Microbacterium sp. HD4P20]|uniref:TrmH family RNA methyltransferase n=1 Tax=Microbacterium sp. HD4P20 TaxID=2864874 RepID=UPI001C63BBFE|nr:TrmH family RNA methyltransferase [Microbacterium sp. HD4P20]MCP2637651.1 NshR/TsnR family 23S rRNA methyltransferase [Microbacterium sp. HD4P20]
MSVIDASEGELRGIRAALKAPARRMVVIDDLQNVATAIRAGVDVRVVFSTHEFEAAEAFGLPVRRLTKGSAVGLFGAERLSRTFALAVAPKAASLDDLRRRSGDVVVLDGVRLAGNIGAVVRTTVALGGAGVVLLDSQLPSILDRRLIRASRGLIFALPVVATSPGELFSFMRSAELPLFVADAEGSLGIDAYSAIPGRTVIAFGSERRGCSAVLRAAAAGSVSIPTSADVDSLNVSVAAGIAMHARRHHNSTDARVHAQ